MIATTGPTPLEGALDMKSRGFHVFPLRPKSKTPLVGRWQQWAADATEETIRAFAKAHPDCNWGVHPGPSGHCVLDVDSGIKNGKKGVGNESLAALEKIYGKLPATFTVRTPSGGKHLYFKGRVATTAGTIGPNLDTRCMNSYVVCPGSVLDSGAYVVEDSDDDWIR